MFGFSCCLFLCCTKSPFLFDCGDFLDPGRRPKKLVSFLSSSAFSVYFVLHGLVASFVYKLNASKKTLTGYI